MKTKTKRDSKLKIFDVCSVALSAALIAVCAWITVPIGPVPFTLQTFAVFFVAALLGRRKGTLAVAVYILLGAAGAPVFSGFKGGIGALMGVTGGYIVGFLIAAYVTGLAKDLLGDSLPKLAPAMLLSLALLYAFGTAWFIVVYMRGGESIGVWSVLSKCVIPFLIPDAAKIALACAVYRLMPSQIKRLASGA